MASATRHGEAFTREYLETAPDDGRRSELIDGTLIVRAAPGRVHQRAAFKLGRVLDDACPDDMEVLPEPVVRPAEAALIAWELDEKGRYREVAKVTGDEPFEAMLPFPVTVVPADLVSR